MPVKPIPTEQIGQAIGNPAFMPGPEGPPPMPGSEGLPPMPGPEGPPPMPSGPEGPPPMPSGPDGPSVSNAERDMRTEVTEADKGPVEELTAKGLSILHSDEVTNKLKKLIEGGQDPVIAAADVLDDVLLILDKEVVGGIPFAQLVLLAIILLSDLNKIVGSISGKPLDKSNLKLALKSSLENVVGKEKLNELKGVQGGLSSGNIEKTTIASPSRAVSKIEATPPPGGALANIM